jgi:hypothetical protein
MDQSDVLVGGGRLAREHVGLPHPSEPNEPFT